MFSVFLFSWQLLFHFWCFSLVHAKTMSAFITGMTVSNNVFIGYFTFHRKTGLPSVQSVLSLKKSCRNRQIKRSDRTRVKNAINTYKNKSAYFKTGDLPIFNETLLSVHLPTTGFNVLLIIIFFNYWCSLDTIFITSVICWYTMFEMIGKCISLNPDALERSTLIRHAQFSASSGYPVLFRWYICLDLWTQY